MKTALLLIAACAALPAADVVLYRSADLKAYEKKLGAKASGPLKSASQALDKWENHLTMISHRQADGEAEIHDTMTDYFVVQTGEATLVTGGKVKDPRSTGPNEIRGPAIEGGQKVKLAAGDVVHIPAKTPHQLLVEKGKQFTYFVIKVQTK